MAVTARIAVLSSVVSYLLVLSAASRVAVFPSHEDDGPLSLPSDEKRTTEVSLPAIDAEGFQQVDLTLRRPVDVRHLHHVHLRGLELAEADDVRDHHHHHHPHHHHGHDHDHHHDHHHHEGFVIPYGDDMLMGENSMPRKGEGFEMEAAERGAVEELKEWNPASMDWEQAAEERRGNRKVKCEHKKKRFEDEDSDSDSDDEDDDEMEMRKKELKRMRRRMRKEKPPMREEGGWMEWFSGVWNGF